MKRLLYLLFLIPSIARADSVTQGPVGFLKVSTGIVDPHRRYDDKQNANWDIAAASMAALITSTGSISALTQAVATDTTTLYNQLTSTSVKLSNYISANNTSTTTLYQQLTSTSVQLSNYITANNISTTTLGSSTDTLKGRVDSLSISTGILYSFNGTPLTFQGSSITALAAGANVTISVPANSSTATIASTGGGNGTSIRPFRIIVGTSSTQNVDIVTTNQEGIAAAISSLTANGGGTLIIREGLYITTYTVGIPSYVWVIADANAQFRNANANTQRCFYIQGRWTGGVFSPRNLTTSGTSFILLEGSYAQLDNAVIRDSTGSTNAGWSMIKAIGNNATIKDCVFQNNKLVTSGGSPLYIDVNNQAARNFRFIGNRVVENYGAGAAFFEIQSTNSFLIYGNSFADNQWTLVADMFVLDSTGGIVANNTFDNTYDGSLTQIFTQYQSDNGSIYQLNIIGNSFISGTTPILFDSGNGAHGYASQCVISNNTFVRPITAAIQLKRSATGVNQSTLIHGNVISAGSTFTSEDASSVNTHHRDNIVGPTMQTDD